jgi:hypothetical protein
VDDHDVCQYSTNVLYKITGYMTDKKAVNLGKAYVSDAQPKIPKGWNLYPDVELGGYVKINHKGMQPHNTKAAQDYYYDATQGDILTKDWSVFEADMNFADLAGLGHDFLMWRQCIEVTEKQAASSPKKKKSSGKDVVESDDEVKPQPKQGKRGGRTKK